MIDPNWIIVFIMVAAGVGSVILFIVRLQSSIYRQFQQTQSLSEQRAIGTHARIDTLRTEMSQGYVRTDVHDAHIERLDAEIDNLKERIK